MPINNLQDSKPNAQQQPKASAAKSLSQLPSESIKDAIVKGATRGGYAIIVTDHSNPIEPVIYVNGAFETLTGYKLAEVIGFHPHFLTHDREQAGAKELETAFRAGHACSAILRDFRKNFVEIWYQVNITPILNKSGQVTHFFGFLRDVTEQIESKTAEEDMEIFIASLAHDMKTPLSGADRMFALIKEGEFGSLAPELNETISLLSKGNRKALDLVRNLIESFRSRKKTGLLHFEIVALPEMIGNAVQEIEAAAEPDQAKIVVTIGENLPSCIYDRLAISRVITNLLDNAVKFSPDGGEVRISAELVNDQILLKVSDDGIGIHEQDKDTIFRKCKRNQKQRHTPGCGLGLYICKEIVKAHNGVISVESVIGMGTTMSVLLPIVAGKNSK